MRQIYKFYVQKTFIRYLDEKFKLARITTINDEISMLNIRYNACAQEFEFLQGNNKFALNNSKVKKVELDGTTLRPIRIDDVRNIFAIQLVSGRISFSKYLKQELKKEK